MIDNAALQTILETADDFSVVVEFYASDAVPPFDPSDAVLTFAAIEGLTFDSISYTKAIRTISQIKRTITKESNEASTEFSNLDNTLSNYEFTTGFEGLIKVVRLISRAQSTLANSLILFVGRCERPESGTRETLTIKAQQITSAITAQIPRRKYSYDDSEGRPPQDPEFEGFRFVPQYGVTTYSARVKRGGLLGLLGFKKTVTKNLQWSSYSDLDADKFVPECFGRVQLAGTHVAYADTGNFIQMTTAFCEGPIKDYINWRTDDLRFYVTGTVHKRFGFPPNLGPNPYEQQPIPNVQWIGNGYYSNTAMIFATVGGTNVLDVDPAPMLIVVALGKLVTVPDSNGDWVTLEKWSDNPAAQTRHILTNSKYYNLDEDWLNDDSFTIAWNYNTQLIWDTSYTDLLFLPNTANFSAGDTEKGRFFLSTGHASPEYFQLLNGDKTEAETYLNTPLAELYDSVIPIEPELPSPGPGGTSGGLLYFLRRRYTCNVVLTEQMQLSDFLHDVIFTTARHFLAQDEQGRIKLGNKKPADWALATAAASGTSFAVDDISAWVADQSGYLLIDPHTTNSEIRIVEDANYSTDQNSVTLTKTGNLTLVAFSGCDGGSTPATATITVTSAAALEAYSVTLDGTLFNFVARGTDTTASVAGFIYGSINSHPVLRRRFSAAWTPGTAVVTITGKFGSIVVSEALEMTHVAPITSPTTAPTLAASGGGTLGAGDYKVTYAYTNARGETLMSSAGTVTLTANQKIDVTGITPPAGVSTVRWYCSPAVNSNKLRLIKENDGSAFTITTLPKLIAGLPPEYNRTGCEIIRVKAVFSDREESRSAAAGANVLQASFKWRLANKDSAYNRVDLKFRDSSQDFRLIELRLKDEDHIAKIKKVNNLEINGQGIDNYHQAYRIASGLLAEKLDADLYYSWTADRGALMLEEFDVVAITDRGAGVYNFPVFIEAIEFEPDKGFVKADFTARKYATTLFDDSVAERQIPVILENGFAVDFV